MIRNIIFDIGNVLVDFRWRELMSDLQLSKEEQDRFETSVFGSRWWRELDHGVMEEAEAVAHIREENKDYLEAFEMVWENRDKLVVSYDYAVEWIEKLHKQGYRVYLLSNYPRSIFQMHADSKKFTFLDIVDGKVVSGFVKMIKPNPDIYEYLMEQYRLKPQECVFLDDREDNIETAKMLGMQGIVFQDYNQACEALEQIISREALR